MQDSRCDSDIDCNHRKLKISYERREFFSQIFIFSNFGMFLKQSRTYFRRDFFFQKVLKFQKLKIKNDLFINATALRAPPAVTRLTVHRRLQVARRAESLGLTLRVIPGRMPFGLICRLRNLFPGNRTEAISRNLFITFVKHEFCPR